MTTLTRTRTITIAAVAAILILLTFLHTPYLNGPWYWQWAWIRLPLAHTLPFMLLAALPALLAQRLHPKLPTTPALFLVMLSLFAMQFACARRADDPLATNRLTRVVGSTAASSYFRSAGLLLSQNATDQPRWLSSYPSRMHDLYLHAKNKPPGLVILHIPLIRSIGFNELAASITGLLMSALTPLCVPATYLILRSLTRDRAASFLATSLLPFLPSLALLFPSWDQFFPVFTAAIVAFWVRAVDTRRALYAILFGLSLALATFFTFNLLVLGIFLAGYAALHLHQHPTRTTLLNLVRLSAIALATLAAAYLLLFLLTGYNPLATLVAGIANQHELERTFLKRPYPYTIPFDLLDFLLGAGWLPILLFAYAFLDQRKSAASSPRPLTSSCLHVSPSNLSLLVLAQLTILALTGLLATETARVWTFLLPLFLIPIAFDLPRYTPNQRLTITLSLLAILIALTLNMRFVLA